VFTNVTIRNFQAFGDLSGIRLAPITLIFGPNSAGKSSVGRALRYMQQSFSPKLSMQRNTFVANDFAVNLASYKNLVHNHDIKNVVQLGLKTKPSSVRKFDTAKFSVQDNQLVELELAGAFNIETPDVGAELRYLSLKFLRDTELDAGSGESWRLSEESFSDLDQIIAAEIQSALTLLNDIDPKSPNPRLGLLLMGQFRGAKAMTREVRDRLFKEVSTSFQTTTAIEEARNVSVTNFTPRFAAGESFYARDLESSREESLLSAMERRILAMVEHNWASLLRTIQDTLVNNFEYVKPLRDIPERLHVVSNDENVMNSLAQDADVRLKISDWLTRITHGAYELDYIPISSETNDIFGDMGALVLKDNAVNAYVSFEDAGTGLSQVLPILAWLAKATTSGDRVRSTPTVLIEQPELHLHPRMQGELFDLFADVVSSNETKIQIITETHSEAFLLRAQTAIREGRLNASDVCIVYVDKVVGEGSRAFEIELSPDGDLTTPWPDTTNFSDIRFDQIR
jgi:predicted ATPase